MEVLARSISKVIHPRRRFVRLLDVGSGDGAIIRGVCQRLVGTSSDQGLPSLLSVDCVEPSPVAAGLIRQAVSRTSASRVFYQLHRTTIEDFLTTETPPYDAIVCCHMLYHIPQNDWPAFLLRLVSRLRSGGALIVNLVSSTSDIYQIKAMFESRFPTPPAAREHDRFGFESYAEDFETVTRQLDWTWKTERICAQLVFRQEDVNHAVKRLCHGVGASALLRFLSLMYRVTESTLTRTSAEDLRRLLLPAKTGIRFTTIDKMFIYRKAGSS